MVNSSKSENDSSKHVFCRQRRLSSHDLVTITCFFRFEEESKLNLEANGWFELFVSTEVHLLNALERLHSLHIQVNVHVPRILLSSTS